MNVRVFGFTLIELMVTISIIAIIIAIGIASYTGINKRSRDTKRKSDLEQIRSALEMYRAQNGFYPQLGGLEDSFMYAYDLDTYLVPSYMSDIPSDPINSSNYMYRYKATSEVDNRYYGYCLSAFLETQNQDDTCTPDSTLSHNIGLRNP